MNIQDLRAQLSASPYYARYGINLDLDAHGSLVLELPASDKVIGNPAIKAIHGGMIAMALELTANLQANLTIGKTVSPLGQTTSYLRRTSETSLFVVARIIKPGRRFVTLEASAWQTDKDKPVATAVFTFQCKAQY